jgi:hypothetical protein
LLSVTRFYRRILLQPVNRAFAEWHASLFAPFAVTNDKSSKQIDIGVFQID